MILILALALLQQPPTPGAHYLIVGGLGGEPDYEQRFSSYSADLDKIARTLTDPSRVIHLSGKAATREALQAAFEKLSQSSRSDSLAVFFIGHGTYDSTNYKFNIPGPDITAQELRAWLDKVPASRQLVVLATSASGAAIDALKSDTRVVVTATRSGGERNAVVFARYWVEALRDPAADADKNETISAAEAFRYAEEKVKRFYTDQKRIATEHARLEGKLAGSFVLARLGEAAAAANDPARRKLLARREALETQIDALKFRKSALPGDQYKRELERLLLELAKVQEAIETK
jgi:hypothetical protein